MSEEQVDFQLTDWQKAMRHFLINGLIDTQANLKLALSRMASLERFVREEVTNEKLDRLCSVCCSACPYKNGEEK